MPCGSTAPEHRRDSIASLNRFFYILWKFFRHMNLRPGAKLLIVILLSWTFCSRPAASQSLPSGTTRADTARILPIDSLTRPLISIPLLGSVDRSIRPGRVIDDSAKHFIEYDNLADLLAPSPGVFTYSLGSAGQTHGLTIQGIGAREIAILGDGILLNEPYSGTYDLNLYPVEEIERIELIPDTRSFLYGLNAAAGAINLVDRSRRAVHPFSHIRYSEDGYGYSLLDGTISEDIIRGFNLTAGARHTTTDGRFPNSNYDAWNGRAKIRYDFSSGLNLSGSEVYSRTQLGLNGGIDSTTPGDLRFDRIQATVRNTDSYEKTTRHDVRLGIALKARADSNAIHALTLYYSGNLREYRDEENRPGANGIFLQQNRESKWYGLKATEHRSVANSALDFGAEVQIQKVRAGPPADNGSSTAGDELSSTRYYLFAKSDLGLPDSMRASAYGRFDAEGSEHHFSFGADGTISLPGRLEIFGGASRSYRFPTVQEAQGTSPVISPLLANEAERHLTLEAGIRSTSTGGRTIELKAFHRTIEDPVAVVPQYLPGVPSPFAFARAGTLILRGVDGSATIRLGSLFLEGNAQYIGTPGSEESHTDFPTWTGSGGVYFWDTLFAGHLNLKAGLRGNFHSSYVGREFNEQALLDVPSSGPAAIDPSGTADLFLIAHLGDAYVHFMWENLFDRHYVMRVFYPMPDRNIRFGISWDFLN